MSELPPNSAGQPSDAIDAGASESSRAPEIVRRATVRVLGERIRLLGTDRSGAYDHYNLQLERGFPIPSYELAILDLIRSKYPGFRSYHEIGSGLGTLPFMLAHDGFASVGVEREVRRHLTATTILRDLSTTLPHVEKNCRLIGAEFPDAVADLDVSESFGILTDFVSTRSREDYIKLCRGLGRYRYVIMDLQRFCRKRETEREYEILIDELLDFGLFLCDDVIDLGSVGYYRLFECRGTVDRPQAIQVREKASPKSEVLERLQSDAQMTPTAQPSAASQELVSVASDNMSVQAPKGELAAELPRMMLPPMPQRVVRRRLGGFLGISALLTIGIPTFIAIAYYGFYASNQYVTSFQFAVRGPSQAMAGHAGAASLGTASAMSPDSFVVTDYINSPQAIADIERKQVDVGKMYSRSSADYFARLHQGFSSEELADYWSKMVWAHFDLISGNIAVSVRAFTPQDSLNLAKAVVVTSDEMFSRLNKKVQQDALRIADDNVKAAQDKVAAARKDLLAFREKSGIVDPDRTSQADSAILDDLRKQLSVAQAQYFSLRESSPNSPVLVGLRAQITALQAQVQKEGNLRSSSMKAVTPELLAEYAGLDLERQTAEKIYAEAIGLRSQASLLAQNQQSFLALFVEPTLPQNALYPERVRGILTVALAAAAAWFVGMLLTYAVKDHLL